MSPERHLYTIAPDRAFLDTLADGLLARTATEPKLLAEITVLLPTRRACRALLEAFVRRSEGAALLLPSLRPLGEVDDDEITIEDGAGDEVPPAIAPRRRQLLLARLIVAYGERTSAPVHAEQAIRLAQALARLIDQVASERLSFEGLRDLVPADYAEHWQTTLDFLTIVTEGWPGVLAAEGALDAAERRNRALDRLAARWRDAPPDGPVIAAGSTGSVPATADLLEVVAGLPEGAVVLPGLERNLDDASWDQLAPGHPQYGLKRLLDRLDVVRDAVADWPPGAPDEEPSERVLLLSEAMRPVPRPLRPRAAGDRLRTGAEGLVRIDCPGPREEAGVIALLLRETLETPGKRAALVTLDRNLARRVAAEMKRFGVTLDDSAGQPLAATPPGAFLRLSAEMAVHRAQPVALLAALKHPLAAGGMAPGTFRALARRLERTVLRGPRPEPGLAGLAAALGALAADPGGHGIRPDKDLIAWFDRLQRMAEPFEAALQARETELDALLRAHLTFAEALATSDEEDGAIRLWAGKAGEAAAALFAELLDGADGAARLPGSDYAAVIEALMAGEVVRPALGGHPRAFLWGPLEARLQQVDRMILGGLNEGSLPAEPAVDPWMSRPMRESFGLPAPERRIGLSAHDFVQCAAAREVVLTRATKVGGTPRVPSRWLTRLDIVLDALGAREAVSGEAAAWLAWQGALNAPDATVRIAPPKPRPPPAARPRQLSVTGIETWVRDPYAIYARYVLKLRPLDAIDAEPGAAERGSFIHKALELFSAAHRERRPDDPLARLLECGREAFGEALARPGVEAFWWPRFVRIAQWFVAEEGAQRARITPLGAEAKGRLELDAPGGAFTLTARADRIERDEAGKLVIIDYKTGTPPREALVVQGLSPQLPLEAAIAMAGGFEGIAATPVGELAYWRLSGGRPAGIIHPVKAAADTLANDARAGLERLIARFDDPETPYPSHPRPEAPPAGKDYDHLARLGEWGSAGTGDDE
jgi:ATP-dependent helicase/nuclease subunit B